MWTLLDESPPAAAQPPQATIGAPLVRPPSESYLALPAILAGLSRKVSRGEGKLNPVPNPESKTQSP